MKKVIGKITLKDLSTYDVRTCTKGKAADNKSFVSSQTAGKTHRVPGNLDATWELFLNTKNNETEIPTILDPGQIIKLQLEKDIRAYTMIIDSSSLEIHAEADEQAGILLSCSADSTNSY